MVHLLAHAELVAISDAWSLHLQNATPETHQAISPHSLHAVCGEAEQLL